MEQTSYVVDDFVREWKKVWEAVACLPNFESDLKGRLLVDLANEPDSQWQVRRGRAGRGSTAFWAGAARHDGAWPTCMRRSLCPSTLGCSCMAMLWLGSKVAELGVRRPSGMWADTMLSGIDCHAPTVCASI